MSRIKCAFSPKALTNYFLNVMDFFFEM
jgi:hypothetical protein